MFRDELDALNAIHQEQQQTNELLQKLIMVLEGKTLQEKEVADHAAKGRSGGNRGKGS